MGVHLRAAVGPLAGLVLAGSHPALPRRLPGCGAHPTFGDFLYMAVNLAFANPPPDLLAHSRVAHMAVTLEVISGVALVALYAGSFFGLGQRDLVVVETARARTRASTSTKDS